MSTAQDSIQLDQPFDVLTPHSIRIPDDASPFPQQDTPQQQRPIHSSSSPSSDKTGDQDTREPLKEVTKSKKGNQESPDQEQQDSGEKDESSSSSENSDKVTEYVAKVLDKLVKQRTKAAKMSASLDKRGSASKRRAVLEADEIHSDGDSAEEDEEQNNANENENDNSKENLSPIRSRQAATFAQDSRSATTPLAQKVAPAPTFAIEDVLQISKTEIHYGPRFPGQVAEEQFDIVNKSGHDFVVQIIVSCLNEELRDTDEYVYSVRRSHLYDYNDKHFLIMAPYSCASFKFALKVPNMKISGTIMGQVEVSIQGVPGSYSLDLAADVSVPKVFCPKELRCNGLEYKVIKLAIKEGKKQDIKIPIKNIGDVPVTMEFEFFEPKDGTQDSSMLDCLVHPNVVTIPANGVALTSVLVKPYRSMGKTKLEKGKPVRKIMVGKVRDSALVYSFVFWIELY